jgi:hypothetical protein
LLQSSVKLAIAALVERTKRADNFVLPADSWFSQFRCHQQSKKETGMRAKFLAVVVVALSIPLPADAQESTHELAKSGGFGGAGGGFGAGKKGRPNDGYDTYNGFLTPGQIDSWLFDGEKGETVIVHVSSTSFDPLLGLAQTGPKQDVTVVADVDDPGTESRFMKRLPEKGKYKIRITAFKNQGGGNYVLKVRRFQARPLEVGKLLLGTFDNEGKSYYYFPGVQDTILIPELKGWSARTWTLIDFKGREVLEWEGTALVESAGECCLVVSGQSENRYELIVRQGQQRALAMGKNLAGNLQQGELDVWSFQGKPEDFRLVEIEKKGAIVSRLIYAPLDKQEEQPLKARESRAEIASLPAASRGNSVRYASILARDGRYQLQILALSACSYKLTSRDPSIALQASKEAPGQLPVGSTAFYSFKAAPGQLFNANLASEEFVPELRLYDKDGVLLGQSTANDDALAGRITRMIEKEGLYRLQVSSLGDGGGGKFRLELKESKLKDLPMGGRGQGTVQPGAMDFWTFAGKEGQTIFVNVRSSAFEPSVSIRSADGVSLAADSNAGAETGSLIALKLPKTGQYSVWISSKRGAGEYVVRLIDAD